MRTFYLPHNAIPDEDWTNDHQESEIVMQPPIKRAPVKEIPLHKPVAQPTQYLYPRERPRNEKFTDDEQHKGEARPAYRASPPRQQPIVQQKMESNSRKSSVASREEEEVRPILTKNRPNYNPQRFREIFRGDEEPKVTSAPKPSRHFIETSPPEEEDIRKRLVHRMPSRDYDAADDTPIKYEKHFARPIIMDRASSREDPHNESSSGNHSYVKSRDTIPEKTKYSRAESQDRNSGHNKTRLRESMHRPEYYEDDVKVAESDHGTTSSLEKFMMRQQQAGKGAPKPNYKEPTMHEKEVTYRPENDEYFFERNPYREPESQPYRESIEKMLKSPVMRYNSFDDAPYVEDELRSSSTRSRPNYDYQPQVQQSRRYRGESPARGSRTEKEIMEEMSNIKLKVSPQDRFRDAKEKFQKMEKVRGPVEREPVHYPHHSPPNHHSGAMPRRSNDGIAKPTTKRDPRDDRGMENMNSLHRTRMSSGGLPPTPHSSHNMRPMNGRRGPEWSSEEDTDRELMMNRNGGGYRELGPGDRLPGLDRPDTGRLLPAKSLGNLVKGYRHSYAEPHNMMSRSGRVGLAAVNPY